MIAQDLLVSPCAENRFLLELLEGGGLPPRQKRELEAHAASCASCGKQWRWVRWSNDLIGRALADAPLPAIDARFEVRRMMVERVESKLARAFDQVGKRLLIAAGGAANRIIMGVTPSFPRARNTARQELSTLHKLDRSTSLGGYANLVKRMWNCTPGSPASIRLADDVLRAAGDLDGLFIQPIIRRIQLAPRGQTLRDVELLTENVLTNSAEPYDRSLALNELAIRYIEDRKDIATAAELAEKALEQDPTRGEVMADAWLFRLASGTADLRQTQILLRAGFPEGTRTKRVQLGKDLGRVIRRCIGWLRRSGLLSARDSLALVNVISEVVE